MRIGKFFRRLWYGGENPFITGDKLIKTRKKKDNLICNTAIGYNSLVNTMGNNNNAFVCYPAGSTASCSYIPSNDTSCCKAIDIQKDNQSHHE